MATIPVVGGVANYHGEIVPGASGSIAITLTLSNSSGFVGQGVQVSAKGTTCTGCSYPETQIEYRWDFSDSGGVETFTCPVTGAVLNANSDQHCHEAGYLYRSAGTKTITCTARVWTGSAFITATATTTYTVNALSLSMLYFDSVGGADGNNGLTSGAPKQTYSAIKTWLEGGSGRGAFIKGGSSYTAITTSITIPATTGCLIEQYSTGNKPIFKADAASTNDLFIRANAAVNNVVFHKIELDGTDQVACLNWGQTAAFDGITLDTVYAHNAGVNGGGLSIIGCNCDPATRVFKWNCVLLGGTAGGSEVREYWELDAWWFELGGTTGGGIVDNPTHHKYIFGLRHFALKWHDFTPAPASDLLGRACVRYACGDVASGGRNTYSIVFERVNFRNHSTATGFSGTNLGVVTDGAITSAEMSMCAVHVGGLGGANTGVVNNNATDLVIRDCVFYNSFGQFVKFTANPLSCRVGFYRNRMWTDHHNGDPLIDFEAATIAGLVEDNTFQLTGADEYTYQYNSTKISATFRRNQYKYINDAEFSFDLNAGANKTLAQWKAMSWAPDADAVTTDPGWTTPASGVFDAGVFALCDSTGIILSLDGGSITGSPATVLRGASLSDTFQLHNIATTTLTTGSDEVAVSGSGTYGGTGLDPVAQIVAFGGHFQFTVSRTTSVVGAKTYVLSTTHDGTGSPFTTTVAFTVLASNVSSPRGRGIRSRNRNRA